MIERDSTHLTPRSLKPQCVVQRQQNPVWPNAIERLRLVRRAKMSRSDSFTKAALASKIPRRTPLIGDTRSNALGPHTKTNISTQIGQLVINCYKSKNIMFMYVRRSCDVVIRKKNGCRQYGEFTALPTTNLVRNWLSFNDLHPVLFHATTIKTKLSTKTDRLTDHKAIYSMN